MLEQLGSDYNNPLSFHGWRRSQVSPMPYFLLPWRTARHSAFGICALNAVISGQRWEEANGRGMSERENNINNGSVSVPHTTQ